MTHPKNCITNKTYDEIQIGDSETLTRTLTRQDIQLFATVTGDMNPAHLDESYAKTDIFHQIVGHGMWTASMFSVLLGMQLPGPGTLYLEQTLKFLKPVHLGDTITASIKVIKKDDTHKHITFQTLCANEAGEHVLEGEAIVLAPANQICWKALPLPEIQIKTPAHNYEQWLLDKASNFAPLRVAVVHPVDIYSLAGAVEAARAGIIEPVLVGSEDKIRRVAENAHIDLNHYEIISTPHSHAAAAMAAQMAARGDVEALMKGKLHTDELMEAVVEKENGLRTGRRMSHVFVLDVPSYPKPLFLTDAAINIRPTLMEKKDIVQNAIDLFTALELGIPKVAILSAVEMVSEKIPSTLDATALCKMAERGQIRNGIIDGPLAFDNAISKESAEIKGIASAVAGDADILVVPDVESGNMLYKELRYFSGAQGAGIVLGAKVPIILTSRAGDAESRVISSALALLFARKEAT
ncbi:MAG: bifunctional enoyl-CoA hydratase/phosphate acetyltransferase [Rhodospirillales bacterium]|nr:bifunctional enoyl-CoA hydratase/phosphate acetyltransferase [Rhodospirillales bacterium]MCB9980578.1 bifunctional enoyl-CoA hydratase/phosphate acetyltransferase [Rhodospirillales bacterium]